MARVWPADMLALDRDGPRFSEMEIRLLGVTEASAGGRPIALGAAQQRAVLAMLALRAGTPVSVDRLIEGLWGEGAPSSANKMVQLYVSQLRRLVDGGEAEIVTRGRGYELRLPDEAVDALRFERLVEAGEGARGARAVARHAARRPARHAVRRGRVAPARGPLAPRARARHRRGARRRAPPRSDGRARAARRRASAARAAARPADARALPLRPPGRRARAPTRTRYRVLDERRGSSPARSCAGSTRRSCTRIRRSMGRHARRRPAPPKRRARWLLAGRRRRRDRRRGRARARRRRRPPRSCRRTASPPSTRRTNEVVATVTVGESPGRSPWAPASSGSSTSAARPCRASIPRRAGRWGPTGWATPRATSLRRPPTSGSPRAAPPAATLARSCTSSDEDAGGISRRRRAVARGRDRPSRGVEPQTVPGCALAAEGSSAWVATNVPPGLVRADYDASAARTRVAWAVPLPHAPAAVAVGAGAVWALDAGDGIVRRLDPESGAVDRELRAGANPVALVARTTRSGWPTRVTIPSRASTRAPTRSARRSRSATARSRSPPAPARSGWCRRDGSVARIDPATNQVTATIAIGQLPQGVAVAGDTVWVTVRGA